MLTSDSSAANWLCPAAGDDQASFRPAGAIARTSLRSATCDAGALATEGALDDLAAVADRMERSFDAALRLTKIDDQPVPEWRVEEPTTTASPTEFRKREPRVKNDARDVSSDCSRDRHGDKPQWPVGFTLSVVVPVFNEERTLATIVARLRQLPVPLELILVDDCSTDGSGEILEELAPLAGVHVIRKPQNEGKGAALRTGFAAATGQVVAVQDADLEYDPEDILNLVRPILDGDADVVFGSRFLGDEIRDPSRLHRFGNAVLTWASNRLTGLRLTDMETCYKVFRRDVLRELTIEQNRFGFEPEITAKIARRGYRVRELPIGYHSRGYDEGKKIGWRDGLNALYCIVRYGLRD